MNSKKAFAFYEISFDVNKRYMSTCNYIVYLFIVSIYIIYTFVKVFQ